jgi:hypothetical protein
MSSILGPQNGWNDPPALNRVPKKKKVMRSSLPVRVFICTTWSTTHLTHGFKGKACRLLYIKCIIPSFLLIHGKRREARVSSKPYSAL